MGSRSPSPRLGKQRKNEERTRGDERDRRLAEHEEDRTGKIATKGEEEDIRRRSLPLWPASFFLRENRKEDIGFWDCFPELSC